VVPLRIEVVVPIVQVRPPTVVVREEGEEEEQRHGKAEAAVDAQGGQPLDGLVECHHRQHGQQPYQ